MPRNKIAKNNRGGKGCRIVFSQIFSNESVLPHIPLRPIFTKIKRINIPKFLRTSQEELDRTYPLHVGDFPSSSVSQLTENVQDINTPT